MAEWSRNCSCFVAKIPGNRHHHDAKKIICCWLFKCGQANVSDAPNRTKHSPKSTLHSDRITHPLWNGVVVAWQVQHRKTFANNNWSFVKESSKLQYLKLAVMRTRKWGFFLNRTSY